MGSIGAGGIDTGGTPSDSGRRIVLGILAHVDAGKTTLAESILHLCGVIRSAGRVDHRDAFLDNFSMERARGITIFSKQAEVTWGDLDITLLDTPGHVDFSAEMERTLQVLDYAVLVVSGADGVQGHTRTLWRLLARYGIPTFLFVNKMDQQGADSDKLLAELRRLPDGNCVAFGGDNGKMWEDAATCDERLMEYYLEHESLTEELLGEAIAQRRIFPCFFGAALLEQGVRELLDGLERYALEPEYPEEFGARVYKISRDDTGARLTHLKVTGGKLKVRQLISKRKGADGEAWQEKVDQLRIYNGARYDTKDEVKAGEICAVTGLGSTFAGEGLGGETESETPLLEPVLTYCLNLPEGSDPVTVLGQLRRLEEEEPLLHILWREESREIHVQVMGEVQIEILKRLIEERYGIAVEFGAGSIVYKETIAAPAVGIGHFEPLRHYAEVHLLLEPGEPGSGLQYASLCSEDVLDKNWQRLILTHLEEKTHAGVLTGAQITDMRIVLMAGRAHLKHTEGGDFRQATYRAVRQGLMRGGCILLEPVFAFTLEVPTENLGRAMSDIQRMCGSFEPPVTDGEISILTGKAPVAAMRDYQREVNAYTHGLGRLSCVLKGYEPCHNAEEVIADAGYDPEADLENPVGSVFCAHGAGFVVNWDEVEQYAHVENRVRLEDIAQGMVGEAREKQCQNAAMNGDAINNTGSGTNGRTGRKQEAERYISQEEIEAIFRQTYGKKETDAKRRRRYHISRRTAEADRKSTQSASGKETGAGKGGGTARSGMAEPRESFLLVDGYNIIFAWEELRELAEVNIDSARDKLMDILSNYQGSLGGTLILVYDAYKVKGNPGSVQKYHNIFVVYTKEAETADQYIEKTVHEIAKRCDVTVATSDALEQLIIWGDGAMRMSALGLKEAVENAAKVLREGYMARESKVGNRPFEGIERLDGGDRT